MDGLSLLMKDHRTVNEIYSQFSAATSVAQKSTLRNDLVRELSVHDAIEGQYLYPLIRKNLGDDVTERSLQEHQEVRELLYRIDNFNIDADEHGLKPLVDELMHNVQEHVEKEETTLFPMLRERASHADLMQLATDLTHAKASAPTHPHPMAPLRHPTALKMAGMASAPIDKLRDMGRDFSNEAPAKRASKRKEQLRE